MMKTALIGALALLLSQGVAIADDPLREGHPDRYVVQKGDTLWGLAQRFLREPWRWPEVWHINPDISNPHLIYPGDTISLSYAGGRPALNVVRGRPTVKLSPRTRATPLELAIPTVPINAIRQFLTRPRVFGEPELMAAPYVVTVVGESVVGGAGNQLYVRGIVEPQTNTFTIFRPGQLYVDPQTGENLGFESLYLGGARLQREGDPATLEIQTSTREITVGDRLLPDLGDDFQESFMPREPDFPIEGRLIAVLDGVSQIGQFNVVTINRGAREGLQPGHVLAVYQTGGVVRDPVSYNPGEYVRLPDEPAGVLMVFRTFEKVSYGLIMSATRAIHMQDTVRNP